MALAAERTATLTTLQAGRAIAALAVVVFHAALGTAAFVAPLPATLDAVARLGELGVDFFFVLSGFVITHASRMRQRTVPEGIRFLEGRLIRIFAPYLPIGLAMVAIYTLAPGLSGAPRDWGWLSSLFLLPTASPPALSVAWTLQHELIFYVLFAFLFFSGRLVAGCLVWAGLIVASWYAGAAEAIPARFFLGAINLEFLFGVAAALWVANGARRLPPALYVLIGAAILTLWWWLGAGLEVRVVFGLAVAFIMVGATSAELAGRLGAPSVLILLGNASYAIYLLHNPIVSVTSRLCAKVPILDGWLVAMTVAIAVSVAAGLVYHLAIEKPLMALLRHRLLGPPHRAPGAATLPAGGGAPR
ncbi:MAG: acyltransferase family protein [Rhizobiales bacterium]|nr:acyltransferase family protein [Hyphomicrobiales bacterium]